VSICSAHNLVTLDTSICNLTDNVLVGEAYNQTVFGCVVLVLVLEGETLAGIVICLALAPPAEFNLVPLEVLLVLNNLDKRHFDALLNFATRAL